MFTGRRARCRGNDDICTVMSEPALVQDNNQTMPHFMVLVVFDDDVFATEQRAIEDMRFIQPLTEPPIPPRKIDP